LAQKEGELPWGVRVFFFLKLKATFFLKLLCKY